MISTASRSLPLKDWLTDEHDNTFFFTIPSQPMSSQAGFLVLSVTDWFSAVYRYSFDFSEKYRNSMSAGNVLKTESSELVLLSNLPLTLGDKDIYHIIQCSLLVEFLNTLLEISNIFKQTSRVRFLLAVFLILPRLTYLHL